MPRFLPIMKPGHDSMDSEKLQLVSFCSDYLWLNLLAKAWQSSLPRSWYLSVLPDSCRLFPSYCGPTFFLFSLMVKVLSARERSAIKINTDQSPLQVPWATSQV